MAFNPHALDLNYELSLHHPEHVVPGSHFDLSPDHRKPNLPRPQPSIGPDHLRIERSNPESPKLEILKPTTLARTEDLARIAPVPDTLPAGPTASQPQSLQTRILRPPQMLPVRRTPYLRCMTTQLPGPSTRDLFWRLAQTRALREAYQVLSPLADTSSDGIWTNFQFYFFRASCWRREDGFFSHFIRPQGPLL